MPVTLLELLSAPCPDLMALVLKGDPASPDFPDLERLLHHGGFSWICIFTMIENSAQYFNLK